jgi:hypothetical protein
MFDIPQFLWTMARQLGYAPKPMLVPRWIGLFFLPLITPGVFADPPATAPTTQTAVEAHSLFDPAKHMRVSEVRPGMKGYGLSVFLGTRIDRFDVEVISVLKNFNPRCDVVLIKFSGDNLEHNLAIAGMSGSPIYLYDDTGKARMIGAFAYGWSLQKDPIAGVQPIEYMLSEPNEVSAERRVQSAERREAVAIERPLNSARWTLPRSVLLPTASSQASKTTTLLESAGSDASLVPLTTPLMVGGLSPRVMQQMMPLFHAYHLEPMQAGGGGGSTTQPTPMVPGAVLGIPLVEGDVDLSTIGTCTEVIGNHVVAFGHAFNAEGAVSLPMSGGAIQGIVANLSSSFKLGSLNPASGTLQLDRTVGVSGTLGIAPAMIPVDLEVKYADGSQDQPFHFTVASHPKMTPMLMTAAMASALTGNRELPENHTIDYDLTLEFANGKTVHIVNTAVNVNPADLFNEVAGPITAAAENPFESVLVKKMTGSMIITPTAKAGALLYADVPRSTYRPGETVNAYVTYRAFRGGEMVIPLSMDLPKDLPDGTYALTISDWQKFVGDERTTEPFKFTAQTLDQVFDVLQDASSIRHNALYVRLIRQNDGIAIGHTALPKLPGSRRQILIGAARSDTTQYVSSAIKVIPTERVMSGSADFQITIDKNADRQKVK